VGERAHCRMMSLHLVLVALVWLEPLAARGDVLVTRDGHEVQTRGAWTVKGSLVQFTDAFGRFTSLRLEEVDVTASEKATKEAARPPQGTEGEEHGERGKEPQPAVRVLSDEDFGHVDPNPQEGPGEGGKGRHGGGSSRLVVTQWKEVEAQRAGGMAIRGAVRNASRDVLAEVGLVVNLVDQDGQVLASQPARLESRTLKPGEMTGFQAEYEGFFAYFKVDFLQTSVPLILEGASHGNSL
jgi:hypothetical protein